MLINCVKDEDGQSISEKGDELFERTTKNHRPNNFGENNSLMARDLVILYENIDLGQKKESSKELVNKRPNQYVETIVYNGGNDSDSDANEIYSNEDLHNVISVNNERIDLLNNIAFENTLCHKFGNMHMKSYLTKEYDEHFLFSDPFIREHWKKLRTASDSRQCNHTILPASLLDYICCEHLDSTYMDYVIKYVQCTIEQLKRISNGDYLTDGAKEKWRQVQHLHKDDSTKSRSSALAPKNTWDEIVHSEMDVRCLKTILEKKIILEVPKILCGSFRLFTKQFKKNAIIRRNKVIDLLESDTKQNSIDIIKHHILDHDFALNINSVVVLKALPQLSDEKGCFSEKPTSNIISIQLKGIETNNRNQMKIVEIDENGNNLAQDEFIPNLGIPEQNQNIESTSGTINDSKTNFNSMIFDDLTIKTLTNNINTKMEECLYFPVQKKTPTRIRIKSPYENRSHIIEEKRRKRLLEIRERREKRKLSMNENCKITKHKYAKGAIMAQASNSVTRLSITNKSFYNSIYGETNTAKTLRNINKFQKEENIPDLKIQECDEDDCVKEIDREKDGNLVKYVNKSYYLDDADTEMMYLQMKPNDRCSDLDNTNQLITSSLSVLTTDLGSDDVHLVNPSTTDFDDTISSNHKFLSKDSNPIKGTNEVNTSYILTDTSPTLVPSNTPKQKSSKIDKNKKIASSDECRKSIDEVYNLIRNTNTISTTSFEISQNLTEISNKNNFKMYSKDNYMPESGSESSLKQHVTYYFSGNSIEKASHGLVIPKKSLNKNDNKTEGVTTVIPKVIINSKHQAGKVDNIKTKRETRKVDSKNIENPLKAISQLIHNIDNIQKTRSKSGNESKRLKKNNLNFDENNYRLSPLKTTPQQEKQIKPNREENLRNSKPILSHVKDLKVSQQKEERPVIKNLTDILDEAKEMRGEAVRGPSKITSRIDSLAQPKKTYVKALHEEQQSRFGRSVTSKVHRPVNSLSTQDKNLRTKYKNKLKIVTSSVSVKQALKPENFLEKTVQRKPETDTKSIENETYLKPQFDPVTPKIPNINHLSVVPTDQAPIASSLLVEESNSLGNKLYDMGKSKISRTTSSLTILREYKEHSSFEKVQTVGTDIMSSTSNYPIDVFEDKNIITAVSSISKDDSQKNKTQVEDLSVDTELNNLENALYRQIPSGTFLKRLRLKKYTLTPKQSMKQVFVMHSGNDKTVEVRTTVSQEIDIYNADIMTNLLPILSNDAIKRKLPIHIATVGYVFPKYNLLMSKSKQNFSNNEVCVNKMSATNCNTTVECYKRNGEKSFKDNIANVVLLQNEPKKILLEENVSQKNKTCTRNEKNTSVSVNVGSSTSLDILLGLLNEIKKITTCQSDFVSTEKDKDHESKEVKFILNKIAHSVDHSENNSLSDLFLENPTRVNSQNVSLCLIDDDNDIQIKTNEKECLRCHISDLPPFNNNPVSAQIPTRELVHECTDVPSRFIGNTISRSVSVISTLIPVINKPFSHKFSFCDCETVNSKINKIKALIPNMSKKSVTLQTDGPETQTVNSNLFTVIYTNEMRNKTRLKNQINNNNVNLFSEFDSSLKIKRDVLVTVYSILVFTVFAALTFPNLLFHG